MQLTKGWKRIVSVFLSAALALTALVCTPAGAALETAAEEPAVELPAEMFSYNSLRTHVNLYACEAAGGVYFLQDNALWFYDLSAGTSEPAYTFPAAEYHPDGRYYGSQDTVSSYVQGDVLYFMYNAYQNTFSDDEIIHIAKYDLASRTYLGELTVPGHIGCSVGVDGAGNIYLGVYDYFQADAEAGNGHIFGAYVYSPAGELLAQSESTEEEDHIYAFNGFRSDGTFYYTGYGDYIYWGYHHDMMTSYVGSFSDSTVSLRQDQLGYYCQMGYYEFQNNAALLNDRYLAFKNGSVLDTAADNASVLYISREYDEPLDYEGYDVSAWGPRMLMTGQDILLAYTSSRNLFAYDLQTGEQVSRYETAHYVFSLMQMGDSIVAVEKENGTYYLEVFPADDFVPLETTVINLNETEAYSGHTAEAVRSRWQEAKIDPDTQVFASEPSLENPYAEGVYTAEMQQALFAYSNYLRWLGGLTPFAWAGEEDTRNAGRGAVVLAASGQFDHYPVQNEAIADMDEEFFQNGYDGTSSSNISWGHAAGSAGTYMDNIRGFLDDTSNVSSLVLGHRFTFLQRAGYEVTYGTAGSIMCQTVKDLDNQANTTGTVTGVDNNNAAYVWPGAGAFPVEEISTAALWSVNLNFDKIQLSNKPLTVTITDLDTGEVFDRTDTLGTSRYLGSTMGWFYGANIYFEGPTAESYLGKNYKVTFENLSTAAGLPVALEYTVNFISAEDGGEDFLLGDLDADNDIDIQDVMAACKVIARKSAGIPAAPEEIRRGDLTGDKRVDILDVMSICKILARQSL
ncbi:MAG TPA: hypothetical protein H9668_03990 [Firmicutes bacterium]|nr:hypothetical protein [Bacillota bacterium]